MKPHSLALPSLLLSLAGLGADAQEAPATRAPAEDAASGGASSSDNLQTVTVIGIAYSLERSLQQKRESDAVVDVVSAEDIGKLPDKNIADAVQRLPGVNISKAGAGEGGFSENDRVAIRGTSPSLTETLINGHTIATGDWFIQDQSASGGGTIGRSVSFALLPSEIADKIVVYKSSQADLVEGGAAGVVDIQTRKPLGFKKPFTALLTAQVFYNDAPHTGDPQFNALLNWKDPSNTFGALVQYFNETRHERRDGQEFIGYGVIHGTDPLSPEAPLVKAYPNLEGVLYPKLINATLLRHRRYRNGGLVDLQWQPSDEFSLDLDGFYTHMHAPSYDTSFLANPDSLIRGGVVPTSVTVRDNVLVGANFPDVSGLGLTPGLSDKIYRPFAFSETYYLDLSGAWRPTANVSVMAKGGHSRGIGATPGDLGYEAAWNVGGLNYAMNGTGGLAAVSWPAPGQTTGNGPYVSNFHDPNIYTNAAWHSIVRTVDSENYGQADAELGVHQSIWESVKVGVRFANHDRTVHWPADGTWPQGGPCASGTNCSPNILPGWNGEQYPGNFQNGLNPPPGYSRAFWQIDPNAVYAWEQQYNPALTSVEPWGNEFSVTEKTSAGYVMANLSGSGWRGNFGVRVARTRENVLFYSLPAADPLTGVVPSCAPTPYAQSPVSGGCDTTGTINYYTQQTVQNSFTDVLPSASFKFDVTHDLIARLAAARTMSRPDYAALAPTAGLDDLALAGTAGNPNLKPVRSSNYDAALEWYFKPRSLLSLGLFYMDLTSFVEFQTQNRTLYNNTYKRLSVYQISVPTNVAAHNQGLEFAYEQPLGAGFGVYLNATWASGRTADHQDLYGASKFTGNAELYWENAVFSARAAYNYRSKYLQGIVSGVPEYDDGVGDMSVSLNYKVTDWLTFTFDGLNLNNPILKEYGYNRSMPEAFYVNGRQYYLGVRLSL